MSLAPTIHLSLYSFPPLPKFGHLKRSSTLFPHTNILASNNHSLQSAFSWFTTIYAVDPTSSFTVRASDSEGGGEEGEKLFEDYEVEIEQPYELKFAKGRDRGTYIDAIAPGGSADKTGKFSVGVKVDEFIVRIPKAHDGNETCQSNKVLGIVGRLANRAAERGWRVYLQDEHGTTADAKNHMICEGRSKSTRATEVDAYATMMVLGRYFSMSGRGTELVLPKHLDLQQKLLKGPPKDIDFFPDG